MESTKQSTPSMALKCACGSDLNSDHYGQKFKEILIFLLSIDI
jgi:hypothetical protein